MVLSKGSQLRSTMTVCLVLFLVSANAYVVEGEGEGVIRGDFVSYLHRAFERFDKAHGCFEAAYNLNPGVETLNRLENNLTRLTECRKMLMAAEGKVDQALVGASAGEI